MAEHRHTILLAEDDPDSREAMQAFLESHGFGVLSARNGDEALQLARAGPRPCLILLDLMMPGVSGSEFRRAQQQDPQIRDVPVALLSGTWNLEMQARTLGIRDYLAKPIDLDDLTAILERYCDGAAPGAAT